MCFQSYNGNLKLLKTLCINTIFSIFANGDTAADRYAMPKYVLVQPGLLDGISCFSLLRSHSLICSC
ncbi:hypothetical protein CW304_21140 [Bacillus sp. UFRGS-B20]|nr:hypothetical protein CW304_21140 [Bacillus sp. UFRGS-B20]